MRFWKRWEEHVTDDLSAYSDCMLPPQESARVSEHLKHCESCAHEYDEVRFAGTLARHLARASAPEGLWSSIERRWLERTTTAWSATEQSRWLTLRGSWLAGVGALLALSLVLVALIRFDLPHRATRPPGTSEMTSVGTAAGGSKSTPAPALAHFNLGTYLETLKAASPEQSYRLVSAASPGFVTVEKEEALRMAGLSALKKMTPLPGYRLLTYRASRVGKSEVVQLVYEKGKEAFSVFVAPHQLKFSYGKESCIDAKVRDIRCQKVDCPFQQSYVFGGGRYLCALVSKSLTAEQAAAVMRYFISAHKRNGDK
jgi:putative zinc finger protein